jgi:hypothetical protein
MFVRVRSDAFVPEKVQPGTTGLTLFQADDGRWRLSCGGEYIDAEESDFEVIGSALGRRGVVVPSLNGGWLEVRPEDRWIPESHVMRDMVTVWGREPGDGDFLGWLRLVLAGDVIGFPVLWDRERQLKLVYFLGSPDYMTWTFPREYKLDWPDPELQIEGLVTIDANRGSWAKKAAEVTVTFRNPGGDRRQVCADLIVPAYACKTASESLVDLFPAVTTDDLDWI